MLSFKAKLHQIKERELRKGHMKLQDAMLSTNTNTLPDLLNPRSPSVINGSKSVRDLNQISELTSFYQPYYKGMYSMKDVISNFSQYTKLKAKTQMLEKRRKARQKTIYDMMDKDIQRTMGKTSASNLRVKWSKDGRKIETLVRKETFDISKKNLDTLSNILDRLNNQYERRKGNN